ncbi:MAG: pilus assembly protein PilP [Burkholderiaceae bacterium]|nr:pilus assembly protein PilP [Burkholderiaceae bacterium]
MSLYRIARHGLPLLTLFALAGCSGGEDEVKQWMAQVRKDTKVNVPKLAEPKKFVPFTYAQTGGTDPFNQAKLTDAIAKAMANSRGPLAPDPNRRHEPLEAFPLDTITMVGAIKDKRGGQHAVVQVDKTVYDVKAGDYMGQNDGRITAITENQISLTERVLDASDEWIERKTTIELQENRK